MNLCVTMLSRLRGGHVDDLARAVLDHHEPVLAQGRTLHGIGGGSTSIGAVESVLMLYILVISHCSMEETRGEGNPRSMKEAGGKDSIFHELSYLRIVRHNENQAGIEGKERIV